MVAVSKRSDSVNSRFETRRRVFESQFFYNGDVADAQLNCGGFIGMCDTKAEPGIKLLGTVYRKIDFF